MTAADLRIVGPGFARTIIVGQELVAGADVGLGNIAVERGWTIRGRVIDSAGIPVLGADVTITRGPGRTGDLLTDLARGTFSTLTDSDGRYIIEGVRTFDVIGNSPRVKATREHEASFPVGVPNQDASIDLVVIPTGTIRG